MLKQVYTHKNVLTAAQERIAAIFDDYERISVSISGGKDSTVLAHLVGAEAVRRNRKFELFFLDEEVDYAHTIEQVKYLMFEMYPANAVPVWYQIPFHLTNATALTEGQLIAWEPGKHKIWMRSRDKRAVQHWPYDESKLKVANKVKGFGFYDVLRNYEANQQNTCFLAGVRAVESMHRWRAVSKNPGHKNWFWSTKGERGNITAYPLYDWNFSDVWRYIHNNAVPYNRIYDWMWKKGMALNEIRVSSLIHEKSFKAICELPEFEPNTYNRLVRRIKGIATANLYGKSREMMRCQKLPKAYHSWQEYRDFLLDTYPDQNKQLIFKHRFAKHLANEYVARQQCRQLMLNDYENNLPVNNKPDPREATIKKWMELL